MTPEEIQNELHEHFPALMIDRTERGFSICGRQMTVDFADAFMDRYIPTVYKRGIYGVQITVDEAYRAYNRA